ncbi:MAG: ABC transporter permease [Actinobacteria bacterium]|nr:ABC transporter permease [Actinomycetota bacterium]
MSTTTTELMPVPAEPKGRLDLLKGKASLTRTLLMAAALFSLLSLTRVITGGDDLTSSQTAGITLLVTMPILLAGMAGLWAERVGIVNIGIEGMMIFGTWFGGWGAWKFGPWVGLLLAIVAGALGGLLHAFAVVKFNVNHVISGVAINLLAFGSMRYLSELVYTADIQGAGISQSPPQQAPIPRLNVPFLAGGEIFGWKSPDILGWFEEKGWFLISDVAGVLRGAFYNVSWATIIGLALVPLSAWVLWRTRFGLRVRSSGEAPAAAESLGVKVTPLRYYAMAISGAFAGFGGGFLAIVSSSYYRQGQTGSRGFIGLATTIFGNWRPFGVLFGALLFGFAEAMQLLSPDSLPKFCLFLAMVAGLMAIGSMVRRKLVPTINGIVAAALFLWVYIAVDKIPEPLTKATPYVLTLVVLAAASQRLRPPAHAGMPYRSGEDH